MTRPSDSTHQRKPLSQASPCVRTPGAGNVRPVVPRGGGAGLIKLLWLHGHYISYTSYRTSIAYLR